MRVSLNIEPRPIKGRMPKAAVLDPRFVLLAETFKSLGDYTRVQIVWILSHKELCVSEIATHLSMSSSAVSHHLKILRDLKLVHVRRNHRLLYYSLDDRHINHLLEKGMEHVQEFLQ